MDYLGEFRDPERVAELVAAIESALDPKITYRIMEFCGGHTHAIYRFGLTDLLPSAVSYLHGPGCPVCVLPGARIQEAISLVEHHPERVLFTYADLLRVPAVNGDTFWKVKARGADIRSVHSPEQALLYAEQTPDRVVIFLAIGFETTAPATAVVVEMARQKNLKNFFVLCRHVLTPAAMTALLVSGEGDAIEGFLGPSHVSTIIGSEAYVAVASRFRKPVVIAGFEPVDILQATLMLIRQINEGESRVENQYSRAVKPEGNQKAQFWMEKIFECREVFAWRGLGKIPLSGLALRAEWSQFDAEKRFQLEDCIEKVPKGCICPAILRGLSEPRECPLIGKACLPEHPVGACMVSSEGACAAYWSYGRHRRLA